MAPTNEESASRSLEVVQPAAVPPWSVYLAAICLCLIAFGMTVSVPWHVAKLSVGFLFLLPVLLTARVGGFGPSALAAALAVIADLHFFAPAHAAHELTKPELLLVAEFASAGLLVAVLGECGRASNGQAR